MDYDLPKHVLVGQQELEVRYDFRVILEIFEALNDPDLSDQERAFVVLQMFYLDFQQITDFEEAIKSLFWFINGGKNEENSQKKQPQIVSWEQDFPYIIAPVNRVLGYEARTVSYDPKSNTGGVHWWTFLSAYMEIGECLFAQIVAIRSKRARGKKLDKTDQEFYQKNRALIDIKRRYTEKEDDLVKLWTRKEQP